MLPEMNQQLTGLVRSNWFDIAFWQSQDAIMGSSQGRNITWFVGHKNDEWVLRHYYRGGLVENILGDKYLFTGLPRTRCFQELQLLEHMYQSGLPVPKPIAGRVKKSGLFYRADILIEKIHHAQDLVATLGTTPLPESEWHAIGATIAKFHQAGIFHSDLNAHNILIDKNNKVFLIDFDKCQKRHDSETWQQKNLERLKRSFNKEKVKNNSLNFNLQCWKWLLEGYATFHH